MLPAVQSDISCKRNMCLTGRRVRRKRYLNI